MRFGVIPIFCWSLTFLGFYGRLVAQDFSKIDAHARSVPIPRDLDIKALATALTENCRSEQEKARSFFVWISEHIRYDVQLRENKGAMTLEKRQAMQVPQQVIKRKKAVCEGYTNLFNALCNSVGIRALEVGGITKNRNGVISRNGHIWSLIFADGKWGLVDATWGAGAVDAEDGQYVEKLNDQFFFTAPGTLIEDHYPNDPLFQCLPNPLTLTEFKMANAKLSQIRDRKLKESPSTGFENIADSLNVITDLEALQYMFAAGHRSLRLNPNSNYGPWLLGKYYYLSALDARSQYIQAVERLKSVNFYPDAGWFDQQMPVLKRWETLSLKSLEALENANGQDNYSNQVQYMRQDTRNSLDSSRHIIEENPRLKASVKKGIRVKMSVE